LEVKGGGLHWRHKKETKAETDEHKKSENRMSEVSLEAEVSVLHGGEDLRNK